MAMEMIGFFVRLSSSLLWFQIYRLGASIVDTSLPRETDSDLRNSFLNPPTPAIARQCSGAEEILGGSIYDPAYYTSLFEESQTNINSPKATQVFSSFYSLCFPLICSLYFVNSGFCDFITETVFRHACLLYQAFHLERVC